MSNIEMPSEEIIVDELKRYLQKIVDNLDVEYLNNISYHINENTIRFYAGIELCVPDLLAKEKIKNQKL